MTHGRLPDDLRMEIRIKNNKLYEAIVPVFGSVREFCRRAGLNVGPVGNLINFKASPYSFNNIRGEDRHLVFRPLARKLAEICGYSCEELFPLELYSRVTNNFIVRTLSSNMAIEMADRGYAELGDDSIERVTRELSVASVLKTLSPREEYILKKRWGIGGGSPETLDEVGEALGVTRERIRQIESKAIRKLKHPSRIESLR